MRRLALAFVLVVAGCPHAKRKDGPPPPIDPPAPDAASPVDAGLPPLGGVPWLLELGAGLDDLGKTSVPLGAREKRPVMIALHGGGDRPEWSCGEWRGVTDAYPVIVCPRGQGTTTSLFWSTPAVTKRAIERALAATRNVIGDYMQDAPYVLVGFSMGATQAALLGREDPKRYPRVVLSENGYDPPSSAAFASGYQGERVLLSCTTGGCEPVYRRAAEVLGKRNVPARVNQSGSGAHGIFGDVITSLRRDWPWFVEGAAGWANYAPAAP